jgi:hypothetical protein
VSNTKKVMSDRDFQQTLKLSFNDADASLSTNGFLIAKVGRRVEVDVSGGSVAVYTFIENGVTLYEYTITYTDNTRTQMVSAERTA